MFLNISNATGQYTVRITAKKENFNLKPFEHKEYYKVCIIRKTYLQININSLQSEIKVLC